VGWFKSRPSRPPERLVALVINFIGEQDGPSERELKASLVELFRGEPTVERAYLARVDYDDETGVHVALCVKSSVGENYSLNPRVANIFAGGFGTHEHLDTLFLRDDQEQELRRVCIPFYRADDYRLHGIDA
jgi:hypothetical protein